MERSEELRDVIRSTFEAYSTGDASLIDRHTSSQDGVRLIGSDPYEWWEGERAAEVLKQEMQDSSVRVSSMGDIDAFVEGTVGWVSSRPVWTLEDGREIPTRWTAVFHQEEGEWKMVQAHTSVGVANEELFGG
jgi:ketosteroid isomerase-like protein